MKRNTLLLGLLAFLLAFGLVLSGCGDISGLFGSNDDDDSNNNNNNNNDYTPYGLEEKFNGTPASMGVTSPMSADALVAFTGEVSGWADFVASGGQLYVNGNRVTSPSTTIYPYDTVLVLAPGGTNNNDNNSNYPIDPITGRPIFFQGTLLGLGVSYPISAESLVILKSEGEVHNWAEFIQVCELYVNGTLVVSGSQMINLTDTIKVLAQGDNNNNSNNNNNNGIGPGELDVWFNGTPASRGFTYSLTAGELVIWGSGSQVHSWAEFIQVGELYVNGTIVTSASTMIYPYDTVIVLAPGVSGTETGLFVKFVGTLSELNIYSATLAQNLVDLDIITDFPSWDAFIAAGGKLIANGTAVTSGTTLIQPNDPIRLLKPDYPYGYSGEDGYSGPAEGAPAWVAGLWIR